MLIPLALALPNIFNSVFHLLAMQSNEEKRRSALVKSMVKSFKLSPAHAYSTYSIFNENHLYDEYWSRECELHNREYEV